MATDYLAEQQRLVWQIAQQVAAQEQNKYAIMDLAGKMKRNEENISLSELDLLKYQEERRGEESPLEKQKVKSYVASQRATIERQILENLEIRERLSRHKSDIEASFSAAERYRKNLADLQAAHGPLPQDHYLSYL